MNKVKKINTKTVLDISEYHNSNTGELLTSEIGKKSLITVQKDSGLVSITSEDYAVISTDAILKIGSVLNSSDMGKVLQMMVCTKTPFNLLYNNTVPHTNDTLQKYLSVNSQSMFFKLISRLIKAGILYQIKGCIHGEVRKIYMLNPFLARKRKTFDEQIIDIFDRFNKQIE